MLSLAAAGGFFLAGCGNGYEASTSPSPDVLASAITANTDPAAGSAAYATEYAPTNVTASSALAGWPTASAIDGNPSTVWSSNTYSTAAHTEWIAFWHSGFQDVNYLRMTPRFASRALGFPRTFAIYWSDGSSWQLARTVTNMQTPLGNNDIILALPSTVHCNGLLVSASELGDDAVGNYVFQMGELRAGYDPAYYATEYAPTSVTASSALAGWPTASAIDGNPSTVWSSNTYSTAAHTEWIAFWHSGFQDVNYLRMTPRFASRALGFPRTFAIYWSDGSSWQLARTVTSMQTPFRNNDIILALPSTVHCNGLLVSASELGDDDVGNYVFQMGELRAGYDATFTAFRWLGNDGSANLATVRNIGSAAFDPAKIKNWNYDARNPILAPNAGSLRNIYAPSVVRNGGAWNVYFGGWDGVATGNDEVSVTVSYDNFATFGSHVKVISHGAFIHVNNENVVKTGTNQWQMAYTTYAQGGYNKPGYATSADGVVWVPSTGSASYLMSMTGYPNWTTADVNGGNVIYFDGSQYHMYFIDFPKFVMSYATSSNNRNYTFQGSKFTGYVPQDLKSFDYHGTRYYLSAYHNNGDAAYYSLNTSLASPGTPSVLFAKTGSGADNHITSVGLVTDGTRLYGALYGASAVSSLDQNRIFASWLQRRVTFNNANAFFGANQSNGPDTLYVYMTPGQGVETGTFAVYDTDGTTLLKQTNKVTLLQGDIWSASF
jgi:hypothetical protein